MIEFDENDDPRLTIGEHLEALRLHVLKCVLYVAAALAVCLMFQGPLMEWATYPHRRVVADLAQEVQVEEAPGELRELIAGAASRDQELERALEAVRRREAALRERLEPSVDRLTALDREQAALALELTRLGEEVQALGEAADREALLAIGARREELERRAAALHERVEREVHPFMDRFARAPRMELVQLRYQEGFLSFVKLALVAALFVASPLVARELWSFVAVGLYPHEKRYVHLFAPLTFVAFAVGAAFGYWILIPLGLRFLATYPPPELIAGTFSLSDYLSLFTTLTLVVGAVFELPLVMTFLTLIGVGSPEKYRAYRRYCILGAFVVAAFLTPPDPVTQSLMAVPLIVLYEVGIWSSVLVRRWRVEPVHEEEDLAPPPASPPASPPSAGGGDEPSAPPAVPVIAPPAHETVPRAANPLLAAEPPEERAQDGEQDGEEDFGGEGDYSDPTLAYLEPDEDDTPPAAPPGDEDSPSPGEGDGQDRGDTA